jgi:hypothetical protein
VVDGDGRVAGLLTLAVIEQLLSDEAAEPAEPADDDAAAQAQPERLR